MALTSLVTLGQTLLPTTADGPLGSTFAVGVPEVKKQQQAELVAKLAPVQLPNRKDQFGFLIWTRVVLDSENGEDEE